MFQVNERLTWIRGRHTLKFGGSWNHYTMERYYAGNNGVLGFIAYNASNFTGAPFADFLLDQVSEKGAARWRTRGRSSSIASGSTRPTTSRRPTT